MNSETEEVGMEACEFWISLAEKENDLLREEKIIDKIIEKKSKFLIDFYSKQLQEYKEVKDEKGETKFDKNQQILILFSVFATNLGEIFFEIFSPFLNSKLQSKNLGDVQLGLNLFGCIVTETECNSIEVLSKTVISIIFELVFIEKSILNEKNEKETKLLINFDTLDIAYFDKIIWALYKLFSSHPSLFSVPQKEKIVFLLISCLQNSSLRQSYLLSQICCCVSSILSQEAHNISNLQINSLLNELVSIREE